ncbi:MAG TPA: hypothetical protein VFV86_04080 [Nitrososphaeraceae archaeon]|nr:hypothetical protein [Nitrososphaeraceae archaeon]
MLKILGFLFSFIAIITIILFSANSPSITFIYAQDIQYQNNTNEENTLLLNELESIKNKLNIKVTKLATILQIAASLPQILQPPDIELIDPKVKGIPEDADIEKRKIAKILLDQFKEFSSIDFLLKNGDNIF